MQLNGLISTAAHYNPARTTLSGYTDLIEVPQVKRDSTDTATPGAKAVSDTLDMQEHFESEELDRVLEEMREFRGWGNFNIGFDLDKATHSLVVKIIDRDTGETLRQIPPDEILRIRQHMREALGLIFDYLA